ncbi:FlgO family outer membrane protein [Rheinheimera maricola]|uniref:FlgO domain-containing protein n=1 Tax=Rheinheimera maricola TaxID=2793282 RepID=A0ABS7X4X6_9GAMM|nr:FlgO family outer membrane protein [Rheinheimera maricola]MBZ9610185.1 hypothetical protein [Rheinheimera maricola]
MQIMIGLLALILAGCATAIDSGLSESSTTSAPRPMLPEGIAPYSVHQYAGDIVMQMLQSTASLPRGSTVAVATYVLANNLQQKVSADIAPELGLQLQESIMTLLTQSGFDVVEIRWDENIMQTSEAELVLSREAHNRQNVQADYLLTGTMLPQQHAYFVNTRLINTRLSQVVAAATTEIPLNVFWSRGTVQLRAGKLYRTGQ